MRYLAIDPGDRRTGLAVGDDQSRIVTPTGAIDTRSESVRLDQLADAVRQHEPDALIVGLALNMDGSDSPRARLARTLAKQLEQRCGLPVHLVDERLTSFAADEHLAGHGFTRKQKKSRRDALAAAAILRDYLESIRTTPGDSMGITPGDSANAKPSDSPGAE